MLTIVIVLVTYWLALSLLAFYNIHKILKFYRNMPSIQIKERWKGFVRSDFGKWNQRQLYIGCFTRFPYYFTALGIWLVGWIILLPVYKLIGKKFKRTVCYIQKKIGNFGIRTVCNIKQSYDYKKYEIQTPIVISNHVSWLDVWYLGIAFLPMSIVSKAAIKKTPIIGMVGDFFDTIYVQRNSQNARDSVIQKISQRVHQFNENKNKQACQRTNPLIIFPQGTTTNGKSIINFKSGAFNDLAPITILALNYKCKQFEMGMGDLPQHHLVFLTLCVRPTLEVTSKVMQAKPNQTVDQYCQRCRQQLGKMTGFPLVQGGYRDVLQYETAIKQARQKKTD